MTARNKKAFFLIGLIVATGLAYDTGFNGTAIALGIVLLIQVFC